MNGVMVQGTSSDSGKSFIVTALCRVLADMGLRVCPFKSQNMSNNSCVTADGLEMGRAQGVQAEAARLEPQAFMNPILLKPRKDTSSEIVLMGKVFDAPCDKNYYKDFTMTTGIKTVRKALKHIAGSFDLIVCEGAGSPAEVNLNAKEIVNMRVAREANLPVVLVSDVDRGGAIASIVGTLELLGEDKKRVKGIIFNKFRGDISLFKDAVEFTEKHTGVRVLGVMPWLEDVVIEAEDVLSLNWLRDGNSADRDITIGAVKFPRISNHTDIEAFRFETDVRIKEIDAGTDFGKLDAIVLPGTKSTVLDMKYLLDSGLAEKIRSFSKNGGFVYGFCGGYQMMGSQIIDSGFRDNGRFPCIEGLGLLPAVTTFADEKTTCRSSGVTIHPAIQPPISVCGYEIHFGETKLAEEHSGFSPLFDLGGKPDGAADDGLRFAGSYLHNAFHNDKFRNVWLNKIRKTKGLPERAPVDSSKAKDEAYDALAAAFLQNIDMEYLLNDIMKLTLPKRKS